MDKAIIFQPFDFTSFHICTALLEKGIEITGVHLEKDGDHSLWEEKHMEIGRNANFVHYTLAEFEANHKSFSFSDTVFLSLYDLYMSGKESILETEGFRKLIIDLSERSEALAVLLPIQLLHPHLRLQDGLRILDNFRTETSHPYTNSHHFFLPTIYGPWQPESFLFQFHLINGDCLDRNKEVREWTFDALYAADLIEVLLKQVEEKRIGSFSFKSGIPDNWARCAELFSLQVPFAKERNTSLIFSESSVVEIIVEEKTPLMEGVHKQKQHFENFRIGRK